MITQILANKVMPIGAALSLVAAAPLTGSWNLEAKSPASGQEPVVSSVPDAAMERAPMPSAVTGRVEAQAVPDGQDAFNGLLAELEQEERGNYASSVWESESQHLPSISFVEAPREATAAKIAALGFPVDIVTGAPMDAEGYEQELEEAFESITADASVESATGWIDPESSTIHVEYQLSDSIEMGTASKGQRGDSAKLSTASEDQLNKKLASAAPAVPGFRYVIRQTEYAPTKELTRGGKKFGTCTTGFPVFQGSSRGVLTAGHCPNYAQVPAGTTVKADFRTQHVGSYGDFQWHSTLDTTSNYIQISSSATRQITSQGIASLGSSICNFGMTRTTSSCGTVKSQAACVKFSGSTTNTCRLVIVNGAFTNGGDSGGPWYAGNRAYGIHAGSNNSTQMYYSRVGNAEAILGVTVKIK